MAQKREDVDGMVRWEYLNVCVCLKVIKQTQRYAIENV